MYDNQFTSCFTLSHKHASKRTWPRLQVRWKGLFLTTFFALLINPHLAHIQSKSPHHYSLQVFVLWNLSPGVCCLSPPHTHKHIRTYAPPTSGKIVLVNEIRLNHALAFINLCVMAARPWFMASTLSGSSLCVQIWVMTLHTQLHVELST